MTRRVADALVGDETESMVMTLWDRTSSTFKGMTASGDEPPYTARRL
jgi:hypothetical protein